MEKLQITQKAITELENNGLITKVEKGIMTIEKQEAVFYPTAFMFYYYEGDSVYRLFAKSHEIVKDYVNYDSLLGVYVGNRQVNTTKGTSDSYPYKWFTKNYSSKYSLSLFPESFFIKRDLKFPFTVGVEYESSAGYIPEYYCIHKGLIPLRDGSIRGTEYASTVIKPCYLSDAINTHTKLLSEFCDINGDCSTHIHLGNIPLKPKEAFCIYSCIASVQRDLFVNYLNPVILNSGEFKNTGKDYCKALPIFKDLNSLYSWLGMYKEPVVFKGFTAPHLASSDGRSKWNIVTRYHWCNFINYFFYSSAKTIEFRFLPPTSSPTLIKGMIFLMGEIIRLGIRISKRCNAETVTLENIESMLPKTINGVLSALRKDKKAVLIPFLAKVKEVYSDLEEGSSIPKILLHPEKYRNYDFGNVETAYYE